MEKKTKEVSIVMPCWFRNGDDGHYGHNETLRIATACLDKLIERTPRDEYELIVIDNGSNIGEEFFKNPNIDILIRNKENLGFGKACNQGFKLAKGEYIVCINNDIIVWPGWLEEVLKPLDDDDLDPLAGVVMPALVKSKIKFDEAIKLEEVDLTSNYGILGIGAEFGSLWAIRKDFFDYIKSEDGYYFDENFVYGFGEDRDLWKRVRKYGRETYRTHNTRVFHVGNVTMSKIVDRKKYTEANREYLIKKWRESEYKAPRTPLT